MEEKQTFINWVKTNKKKLIVAGISVAAISGVIIVSVKEQDSLLFLWDSLKKEILEVPTESAQKTMSMVDSISETKIIDFPSHRKLNAPFNVRDHLRNLPYGHHASLEKVASAAEYGYSLQPGQTWVEGFTKGEYAA